MSYDRQAEQIGRLTEQIKGLERRVDEIVARQQSDAGLRLSWLLVLVNGGFILAAGAISATIVVLLS